VKAGTIIFCGAPRPTAATEPVEQRCLPWPMRGCPMADMITPMTLSP
jgi:hypothetical protein